MRSSIGFIHCAAVLPLAFLAACFDAPIRHSLEIRFDAVGSVEVLASTIILPEWKDTDQNRVRDRIAETRDAIHHGEDLWSRAFRNLHPARERVIADYEDGLLMGATRQAAFDDPSSLEELFGDTPVRAYVEKDGRTMTLELVPDGSGGATQRQERRVTEALNRFSEAVAQHLEALAALYDWLEMHPDRARWAMGSLVGARMDEGAHGPTPEGRGLIQRVDETGEAVTAILKVETSTAYSLNELSRMVHDPFSFPVRVEVAGEVLETEGFLSDGEYGFYTRTHGLWSAFLALRGRWVEPVPVVEVLAALRRVNDGTAEDPVAETLLEDMLNSPRVVHDLPDPENVKTALISELTPPDIYRLRWLLPRRND